MKRCLVVLFTTVVLLLLSVGSLASKDIKVTLRMSPIELSPENPDETFFLNLPEGATDLEYCHIIVQGRTNEKDLLSVQLWIDGRNVAGSSFGQGEWSGSMFSGPTKSILADCESESRIEYRFVGEDPMFPCAQKGELRGIGIIFSDTRYKFPDKNKVDFAGDADLYHWRKGAFHKHSAFSDGTETVKENCEDVRKLAEDGGPVVEIVSFNDHDIDIGLEDKSCGSLIKLRRLKKEERVGVDNYLKACEAENIPDKLVVLAGGEFEAKWKADGKTYTSHTLGLGDIPVDLDLKDIEGKEGAQQQIIKRLLDAGLVPDAAHPQWWLQVKPPFIKKWELRSFPYNTDLAQCVGLMGVEKFNIWQEKQFGATVDFMREKLKKGDYVFPTAGQDTHARKDPEQGKRMRRITGVCTKELTKAAVIEALKLGRTYATSGKVFLLESSVVPGKDATKTAMPEIYLRFEGEGADGSEGSLYRDGELMEKSVLRVQDGVYQFWDQQATKGKHSYLFVIWDEFVLAPLMFEVE